MVPKQISFNFLFFKIETDFDKVRDDYLARNAQYQSQRPPRYAQKVTFYILNKFYC